MVNVNVSAGQLEEETVGYVIKSLRHCCRHRRHSGCEFQSSRVFNYTDGRRALVHAPVASGSGSINPFIAMQGVTTVILPRGDCGI